MLSVDCYAQNLSDEQILAIEESISKDREKARADLGELRKRLCEIFEIESSAQPFQFQNLKGVNINIEPTENESYPLAYSFSSSTCFIMPTVNYIKAMGFDDTGENEHTLTIELSQISVSYNHDDSKGAFVQFLIKLTNREGKIIFEQNVHSYVNKPVSSECLNEAYTQSLEKISWHKIASFLKESSEPKQLAKEEPRKQVEGYGNTALENTILRWDVQSRPAGADVFWRVVSKTPSVKSTNNKYLQTTPYEATKSLDIRGLSYENSGDVRIILRCEKEGYYPQEKEFNVRMIIDQEEISAFFRLVKEE